MLTRKNYEAIARLIKDLTDSEGKIDRLDLVSNFSDYFKRDNPNFEQDRFYKACYLKQGE